MVTSGESISASRGTEGSSFNVSVIKVQLSRLNSQFLKRLLRVDPSELSVDSSARPYLRMAQPFDLHGIVVERDRIDLLKQRAQVVLDVLVTGGMNDELAPIRDVTHVSFFDDDLAAFDHVARIGKQKAVIRPLRVDRHVRIGPDSQVALPRQSERARRAGGRDDGDLRQRVLSIEVGEHDAISGPLRKLPDFLLPV